jgi:hypothetical protein
VFVLDSAVAEDADDSVGQPLAKVRGNVVGLQLVQD